MAFSSDTFNLDVPRPWRNGYRTVNERIDILSTATVLEMEVEVDLLLDEWKLFSDRIKTLR